MMDRKLSHVGMQMEGMVTDLQLAREKQQAFETWQRQNSKSSPLDLSVTVLTTGFWPAFKVPGQYLRDCANDAPLPTTHVGSIAICSREIACVMSRASPEARSSMGFQVTVGCCVDIQPGLSCRP